MAQHSQRLGLITVRFYMCCFALGSDLARHWYCSLAYHTEFPDSSKGTYWDLCCKNYPHCLHGISVHDPLAAV